MSHSNPPSVSSVVSSFICRPAEERWALEDTGEFIASHHPAAMFVRLTFLYKALCLSPDLGVAKEPPLSLFADLALHVMLFRHLGKKTGHTLTHHTWGGVQAAESASLH